MFQRVPFGLRNSGAALIHCLDTILGGNLKNVLVVYVDDLVLHTKSEEEHIRKLEELFKIFIKYNVKLNLSKCYFVQDRIKFMGYNVDVNGISMLPEKNEVIQNLPAPKYQKQLRRFLGVCNYYSRFCFNFARHMPMLNLLRKNVEWIWDEACQKSFNNVKQLFLNACTISHPDFQKVIYVQTDSSKKGIGVVLYQGRN